MARAYSMDLRERVVAAITRGGMSRRQAAAHFGVAASSAIKWMQRFRATGSASPGQIGGHKPRAISGAHREWLIGRCQDHDFTLRGLVAELAAERSLKVDYRSVWNFVHRRRHGTVPVKTVADALGVARSSLVAQLRGGSKLAAAPPPG